MRKLPIPLDSIRFACFALGCALLFWQYDAAATDWLFGVGILLSAAIWDRRLPGFDLEWPQPLLVVFLAVAAGVTALAGGQLRFLAITIYLALLALALASTLRRDPRRWRVIEAAIVFAALVTGLLVIVGALWEQVGWPFLQELAYDRLRGKGLFKDPNVAGAFLACAYPLVAGFAMRSTRLRLPFVILGTALIGGGVFFSFSRLAIALFGVALVGVCIAFAIRRQWSPVIAIGGLAVVATVVILAFGDLPLYRLRLIQPSDERGRFVAWVFGLEMMQRQPLGTGAGTFEQGFGQHMEDEIERERQQIAQGGRTGENIIRNGALSSPEGWKMTDGSAPVRDSTSPTGYAFRKETTAPYQDPSQTVPVVAGETYAFAAQIRTDGTRGTLIVHWLDRRGATIRQTASRDVRSTTWTEAEIPGEAAPLFARSALVLLSNREAGVQHFTAVRMVAGPSAAPWAPSMQRAVQLVQVDFARQSTAAHQAYLRVGVESGVLGLLVLSLYLLILAWTGWSNVGPDRWPLALAFSLVLVAGFVIDTLHWRQLWVYAAILATFGAGTVTAAAGPLTRRARRTLAVDVPLSRSHERSG